MRKSLLNYLGFLLLCTFFAGCKPYAHVTKVDSNVITVDSISAAKEDTSSLRIIKPFREKMLAQMNGILGYTDQAMVKELPEGILNNFVADLILKKSFDYYKPADSIKIDFCLLNFGGLRAALPKGAITLEQVYELMPFENSLVVITLNGIKTKQVFDYIAKQGGDPVSGITMEIKDTVATNILVNGKPLDTSRTYKIVTLDYLANGGDKMTIFKTPLKREDLGVKVRDAIITYMKEENKKGLVLTSKLDSRIHYAR